MVPRTAPTPRARLKPFVNDFAKWPKAVAKLTKDREAVLAFYDFPAEHWIHLRTSSPIESTFSPVRARTDVTKGAGSREAGLAMCFKLIEVAEGTWKRVNVPELVALVRSGAKFVNGRLVERTDREDAA
jgi:putative transposase